MSIEKRYSKYIFIDNLKKEKPGQGEAEIMHVNVEKS